MNPTGAALLCLGLAACGGGDTSRLPAGPGIVTVGAETGTQAGTTGEDPGSKSGDHSHSGSDGGSTGTGEPDGTTDAPKFDIAPGADVAPPVADECTKVDLLFAVDNSGSMRGEQESLIDAFPGFVAGIQDSLQYAESYHIGVVTTDSYGPNPNACDSIGDLVTRTGGDDSSDMDCGPYASGFRWFDDAEPDLAATFSCAAQVGTDGSDDEEQMHAVLAAIEAPNNGPGGCNEGFLRDDALLVVVLITDEEDDQYCHPISGCSGGSPGDPPQWFMQLVDAKAGVESNVVMLSLVGLEGSPCAEESPRLEMFSSMFTNHAVGEICTEDYAQFFVEAISEIDLACAEFTPPG